jgi:hypothetical protein
MGAGPAPELVGAQGLESLFPQQGQALGIQAGGRCHPAGGILGLVDGFPQQGGSQIPLADGVHKAQVLHLPATAAAVKSAGHNQAKGIVLAKGDQNQRCNRLTGGQGVDQPLR